MAVQGCKAEKGGHHIVVVYLHIDTNHCFLGSGVEGRAVLVPPRRVNPLIS